MSSLVTQVCVNVTPATCCISVRLCCWCTYFEKYFGWLFPLLYRWFSYPFPITLINWTKNIRFKKWQQDVQCYFLHEIIVFFFSFICRFSIVTVHRRKWFACLKNKKKTNKNIQLYVCVCGCCCGLLRKCWINKRILVYRIGDLCWYSYITP